MYNVNEAELEMMLKQLLAVDLDSEAKVETLVEAGYAADGSGVLLTINGREFKIKIERVK